MADQIWVAMPDQSPGDSKVIPWGRLIAEGAAIVVSILLAFGIDAGWDSRRESIEEREHLASLGAEFSAASDMIGADLAQIDDALSAAQTLLTLQAHEAVAHDPDSLASLFVSTLSVGRANLPSGALDALMASGDLRLVRDRDLASRLAAWPSLVLEAHENAGWLVEHRDRDFSAFLRRYVGGLWSAGRTPLLEGFPPTRFPPKTEEMFSDPELEGQLSAVAVRLAVMQLRYRALAEAADSISTLIDRRLER